MFDAFTCYGADVAALAIVTAFVTQILKKTLLKYADKKIVAFLPFLVGVALYAALMAFGDCSVFSDLGGYLTLFERGILVGALATSGYVMYERLSGGKSGTFKEDLIFRMLSGFIEEQSQNAVASEIAATAAGEKRSGDILEILKNFALSEVSEGELSALAELISRTLEVIEKTP